MIRGLDWTGERFNIHEKLARVALEHVADIEHPRILELGAGHGKLSAAILQLHPSAEVTVSDLDPTSVRKIGEGPLGTHPRVNTKVIDAASIDAEEASFDLVVFAVALHHLPPPVTARAIAESTRVARQFLAMDMIRPRRG